MSLIGLATALSINIDVPPVIATAARTILFPADKEISLAPNEDLVDICRQPVSPDEPWQEVQSYSRSWWNMDSAPLDIEQHIICSSESIKECMKAYKAQQRALSPPQWPYHVGAALVTMVPERPSDACNTCQRNHAFARNCLSELVSIHSASTHLKQHFQQNADLAKQRIRIILEHGKQAELCNAATEPSNTINLTTSNTDMPPNENPPVVAKVVLPTQLPSPAVEPDAAWAAHRSAHPVPAAVTLPAQLPSPAVDPDAAWAA
ncbi:hypothetical protein CPC08DRAFT_770681, partial [Agrocybe pediades]